ncbi:MAG: hypothetical protein U9N55_08395, partial [candidate division Zixibacteria bacterium]|nr:hypothetical protein [candidate division Zixibacteria bacterium]
MRDRAGASVSKVFIIIATLFVMFVLGSGNNVVAAQHTIAMENLGPVVAGDIAKVSLYLTSTLPVESLTVDTFVFRIGYDRSLLSLWDVKSTQLVDSCGWQLSFLKSFPDQPDLPTGLVWIRAIDTMSNENHFTSEDPLLTVYFLVKDSVDLSSGETPVNFVWSECGDNRLSDASNDTTFVADSVFDADGLDITDRTTKLPTLTGFPDCCSNCGNTVYIRNILFRSTIIVFGMPTGITQPCEQNKSLPLFPILKQNYPNPFNPTTVISFSIPRAEDWELEIVNLLGQHIKTFSAYGGPG